MLVQDKLIVVTETHRGRATALDLLKRGAYVAVLDMNEKRASEIEGKRLKFFQCDVTNEAQVNDAVQGAVAHFSNVKLAGLVSAAGIGTIQPVLTKDGTAVSGKLFQKTIQVNLVGTYLAAKAVASAIVKQYPLPGKPSKEKPKDSDEYLPGINTQERGVIVLVASVAATESAGWMSAYGASKGGVVGMLLPMARALANYGIRVVSVSPSIMDTEMTHAFPPNARAASLQDALFPPRFGKGEEFANLVAHVFDNTFLNAVDIRLDGGTRHGGRL